MQSRFGEFKVKDALMAMAQITKAWEHAAVAQVLKETASLHTELRIDSSDPYWGIGEPAARTNPGACSGLNKLGWIFYYIGYYLADQ